MAYVSLYRKYRPQNFKDVVGQDIIVKILKNSIKNNKINHAYIFSGPRGTGKTSIAKIFAKAVNCLNKTGDVCDECIVCKTNIDEEIDIVEIDAASNNGIDEIREIRSTIKLLPSILKYKVYIIDEVHMLSTSAFNALLKTLEEPPNHAIFILATTEINKIPATVLSRCQKFDFKNINIKDIFNRLKYICENEKIEIEDDVLEFISELSNGGLRDAINLLDQINSLNKKNITKQDVLDIIGSIDDEKIYELLDNIVKGDLSSVIKNVNDFYKNNKNFVNVIDRLEKLIKDIIIFDNTRNYFDKEYEKVLLNYSKIDENLLIEVEEELFKLTNELKKSMNQTIISEIYFIKITLKFNKMCVKNNINTEIDNKIEVKNEEKTLPEEQEIIVSDEEKNILINNSLATANKDLKNEFLDNFDKINEYLTSKEYNSVANLLKSATPEVVSKTNLLFSFNNNFEVLLFDKNIELITKFLKHIYKNKYSLVAITTENWNKLKEEYIKNIKNGIKYEYIEIEKKTKKAKKNTELESSIENIFGEDYTIEE